MRGQENFCANPADRASCRKYVSEMMASNFGLFGSSNGASMKLFSSFVAKSVSVPFFASDHSILVNSRESARPKFFKNSGFICPVITSLLIIKFKFGCGRVVLTVTNVTL
uniref:Uncharacterized protein n=1 Tax=Cacopsylla melanoneura TaxID=428564 RepID=A0A8D9EF52_9HEMI